MEEEWCLSKQITDNHLSIYDDFNRLVKILITDASASAGQGRGALVASAGDRGSRSKSETILSYSSSGKLVEIADESGKISFTYDSFGRVSSEKGEIGEIRYEYNFHGLLSAKACMFSRRGNAERGKRKVYPAEAGTQSFKTKYYYGKFDHIVQIFSSAGVYSYTYDSKGRIASLTMSSSLLCLLCLLWLKILSLTLYCCGIF